MWYERTHRLAGGDAENLGGEAHGAFDAELLVLSAVDEVGRDCGAVRQLAITKTRLGAYTSRGS
jgi:hypothetical protein